MTFPNMQLDDMAHVAQRVQLARCNFARVMGADGGNRDLAEESLTYELTHFDYMLGEFMKQKGLSRCEVFDLLPEV